MLQIANVQFNTYYNVYIHFIWLCSEHLHHNFTLMQILITNKVRLSLNAVEVTLCVCVETVVEKRHDGEGGWAYLQQPIASTMEGGDD